MSNKIYKYDDEYAFLTKELLEEEYVNNGLSDKKIAEKYGVGSKATIWRRRKFFCIENKLPNKSNKNATKNRKFSVDPNQFQEWKTAGLTYQQMADKVGCSRMVFYRRVKELGLIDNCGHAQNKMKFSERLTDNQRQFLVGTTLGDGSITKNGMFQCSHSHKQKKYIEYKKNILSNLTSPNFILKERSVLNHQNGKRYKTYHMRTMVNDHIKDLYQEFYSDRGKIFPYEFLYNEINSLGLAFWYMDDGHRDGNVGLLFTYGFGLKGSTDALSFMRERFGIVFEIKKSNEERRKDKCYYIKTVKGSDSQKFFEIVAPHIIPSMQYKLPIKFRGRYKNIFE